MTDATKRTIRKGGETAIPKVLLYDIESSPNIAYIWGKYECDALGDFIKERQVISVAWKWLGEKNVQVLAMPMLPTYKKNPDNNRALVLKLHELMLQADIVVGHNVDAFDDPMSNAEFLIHGLKPPPPHKSVDTLKFARHKFRFNSNKLGDLGQRLGLGKKVHTGGFDLWARCLRGDPKAWALMMRYNKQDVVLLEKIYLKMRPWMSNHPNMVVQDGDFGCPACRSKSYQARGRSHFTTGYRHRFECQDCGKWFRGAIIRKAWKFK